MQSTSGRFALVTCLTVTLTGCGLLFGQAPARRVSASPSPSATAGMVMAPVASPGALGSPMPVIKASPIPAASPAAMASPAPEAKLSFDLFGRHKDYQQVTARVERNPQGQEQTIIQAQEGDNTLMLVVDGTGVGEHKLLRAELKDAQLGAQPVVLDANNPKINGSVTFDAFDVAAGKVSGSFTGGYTGFPPVQVQNGTLVARLEPATAGTVASAAQSH